MLLIYGKGKTGQSVYKFCKEKSIKATMVDDSDFFPDLLKEVKKVVVSPGIPFYHRIYKEAKKRKVPVISDIEFAYEFYSGKIIAITGTDGKTTTTSLIYEILKNAGFDVCVGGNYGIPFIEIAQKSDKDSTVVLELSSFQLYSIKDFKPDIAVILNIDTDHLDWHKKRKHYVLSKLKITKNQDKKDILIVKKGINVKTKANKIEVDLNTYLKNKMLTIQDIKINTDRLSLKGIHNLENIVFSVLTALNLGVSPEVIKSTVEKFKPLPHRLEFIEEIKGVKFYNDSKSTTVHATVKALQSFKENVILILGGINKGSDFSRINKFKEKIKSVIIIGRDKNEIKNQISNKSIFLENSLEEAVKKALNLAEKGDTILFSPACASFDMFKNYIERGEKFKKIVKELK